MCRKGGIWQKPENVLLFCIPSGKFCLKIFGIKISFTDTILEELEIAKENNKKYEIEIENLKSKNEAECPTLRPLFVLKIANNALG